MSRRELSGGIFRRVLVLLAIAVGFLPALSAYRTDVSRIGLAGAWDSALMLP